MTNEHADVARRRLFGIMSICGGPAPPLQTAAAPESCCVSVVEPLVPFLVISPTLHLSCEIPAAEKYKKIQDFNVNNACYGGNIPGVPLPVVIKYLTGTCWSSTDEE